MDKSVIDLIPHDQDDERERIYLLLIEEIECGLADVEQGKVRLARDAIEDIRRRRAAKRRN